MKMTLVLVLALSSLATAQTSQEVESRERDAVASALSWLSRNQREDGSWSSQGEAGHPLTALYAPDAAASSDVMATSVALLAFLGAGNSPWKGRYSDTVERGWKWLDGKRGPDGCLATVEGPGAAGTLAERDAAARRDHLARLNHLWGTLALLEVVASASVADGSIPIAPADVAKRLERVLPGAAEATAFVTADPLLKAARFDFLAPKTATMDELSLLAAIRHVANRAQVPADFKWFEAVRAALKDVRKGMRGLRVPYRASDEGEYWLGGSVTTPQSMISAVWLLDEKAADQMLALAPGLLAHPPAWEKRESVAPPATHLTVQPGEDRGNECGWFWEAMAFRSLAPLAPTTARAWDASFGPLAGEQQRRAGPDAGSWDPVGPHARVFGREITTAWLAIALQPASALRSAQTSWHDLKSDPRTLSRLEVMGKGEVTREKCAVCGVDVLSNTMFSKWDGTKVRYFCEPHHLNEFEMNPSKYDAEGEGSEHR